MLTRTIPKSGEKLPVIGLGTWQTFDVGPSPGDRKDQTAYTLGRVGVVDEGRDDAHQPIRLLGGGYRFTGISDPPQWEGGWAPPGAMHVLAVMEGARGEDVTARPRELWARACFSFALLNRVGMLSPRLYARHIRHPEPLSRMKDYKAG